MAKDQLEHYHDVAEAQRETAQLMSFFGALAEQKGDTIGVKQIEHYQDVYLQGADLYDILATGTHEGGGEDEVADEPDVTS